MAAFEMFSISLSVDGMIKLANSLQHINTTHTFYEAIEEFLAHNHRLGLFEIDPQHMKVYVSKSINSARLFVKLEDSVTSTEPTFTINRESHNLTINLELQLLNQWLHHLQHCHLQPLCFDYYLK